MAHLRYYRLLIIGFLLVLGGVVIPFLTIIGVLPENFLLLLGSYAGSIAGIVLGLVWSAGYVRDVRSRDK
jgi:cytochrome c biogenesis protein CcdA